MISRWISRARGPVMGLLLLSVGLLVACTGERSGPDAAQDRQISALNSKFNEPDWTPSCLPSDFSAFDRHTGEVLDLEREIPPRGLYLAVRSEMLLEKKNSNGAVTRMLVREVPGSKSAEIVCSEHLDLLGDSFELVLSAPVKFTVGLDSVGEDLVARQFYIYTNKGEHGVILSNPRTSAQKLNLKDFFDAGRSMGQLVRMDSQTYLMRTVREQNGVRARVNVILEYVR